MTKQPYETRSLRHSLQLWVLATGMLLATALCWSNPSRSAELSPSDAERLAPVTPHGAPLIQLAILLDTSSSMDGLIDQTRNQLWHVVNELAHTTHNNRPVKLEVAVYEYGNSGLSASTGYIRRVTELTSNLDRVSEALFSLRTGGGDEFCGYVISAAIDELQWSTSQTDLKVIFVAGNEPFTQGPVSFEGAVAKALAKGVTVNTIHAGTDDEGVATGWKQAAVLSGGHYMSIDHNHRIAHIVAPQDQRIAKLNTQLNNTYIPYGAQGNAGAKLQREQDTQSTARSLGLLAQRARSKVSSLYDSSAWDLVDAIESGSVKLDDLAAEELPRDLREMSAEDRRDYVQKKAQERDRIRAEIAAEVRARDTYVAAKQRESSTPAATTFNDAIAAAVREQGSKKNFAFTTP